MSRDLERRNTSARALASAAGATRTPGKQTLVQAQMRGDAPARAGVLWSPIQRQDNGQGQAGAFDPARVQVDQYAPGTDTNRFNDCGPAVVLMVVRAVGAQAAFEQRVAASLQIPVPQLTLQQQLTYIRGKELTTAARPAKGADEPFRFQHVQAALNAVLIELGIDLSEQQLRAQIVAIGDAGYLSVGSDDRATAAHPGAPGRIEEFLAAHCGNGSAVIALGRPTAAAWGWGGQQDPARRTVNGPDGTPVPQSITEQGDHFAMIWAATPGVYTVLDPSWATPRENCTLAQIKAFLAEKGVETAVSLLAVPFAELATHMPRRAAQAPHPSRVPTQASAARGPAAAAPVETGSGERLPAPTQRRMESSFGVDLSVVRVFQGGQAAAMGANAYAQGAELHFAPGQYRPGTPDGDRLIGHEIAHVVQQREGRVAAPSDGTSVVDDSGLEAEADRLGGRAAAGEVVRTQDGGSHVDALAAPVQRLGPSAGDVAVPPGPILRGVLLPVILAHRNTLPHQTTADPGTGFGAAVMALWSWCALHIPERGEIQAYAGFPVENSIKQSTIGMLAARRARLEFLLGWMLQGGARSNGTDWETGGGSNAEATDTTTNAGPIVSQYTSGDHGYGLRGHDWCGMFVGFAYSRVGMQEPVGAAGKNTHSELASSIRAKYWIEDPKRQRQTGERVIRPADLDAGVVPQAGDFAVFRNHVAMIEDYDPSTRVISTVDGNVGLHRNSAAAGVSGYSGDAVTIEGLHGGLWMIWRPGVEAFGGTPATGATATTDNSAGEALVQKLDGACRQLILVYRDLGLSGAVAEGQTVAAMAAASS